MCYNSYVNRLPIETRIQILNMLVEGSSMRSISRVLGISINTVTKLLVEAGLACQEFHDLSVWGIQARHIECDEIWSFCYAKDHNVPRARGVIDSAGDVWTWTALDRDSKLLLCWLTGSRDAAAAKLFMSDLQSRLATRVQITTDGHPAYPDAILNAFGRSVDYATLVGTSKRRVLGNPDMSQVRTTGVERHNLTMRMSMRRFTRRTNAYSKTVRNHAHSLALFVTWYNWVRPHKSLSRPYATTPAMAAGLTTSLHDMEWLLEIIDDRTEVRKSYRSN